MRKALLILAFLIVTQTVFAHANGNLTSDLNKGITRIAYNQIGLPRSVEFSDGHLTEYLYDASGRKLQTKYQLANYVAVEGPVIGEIELPGIGTLSSSQINTANTYIGDGGGIAVGPGLSTDTEIAVEASQYNTIATRDYCGDYIYLNDSLLRINTPIGYMAPDPVLAQENPDDYLNNFIHYAYVKDYQGNIRSVVNEYGDVVEINQYYPYGGALYDGYTTRPAKSSAQPYKYSGNELTENSFSVNHRLRQRMSRDAGKASRRSWIAVGKSQADGGNYDTNNGLNLYDFHARQHDPYAPHFTTIDPLAEINPGISPYVFCAGNPILYIDPTGLDTINVNQKGEIVAHLKSTEKDKSQRVDVVNIVDENGMILKDENNNDISISFDYGTILRTRVIPENAKSRFDVIETRGDKNSQKLYEFLSQNICRYNPIEYSIVNVGLEGDKGRSFISTGHVFGSEPALSHIYKFQLQFGYYVRSISHSHPVSDYPSNKDKLVYRQINEGEKRVIPHLIYHIPTKRYIPIN